MYVDRVRLTNLRGFHGARAADLRFSGPGWTVLAGRNGSGKSTLLKAIALAVMGDGVRFRDRIADWVSTGAESAKIEGTLSNGLVTNYFFEREDDADFSVPRSQAKERHGFFCIGYGPFRTLSGGKPGESGPVDSLFSEEVALVDGVPWLVFQHLRTLEGKAGADGLRADTLQLLDDGLLPDGFRVRDVDSDGLWVDHNGVRFPLESMSDGYRSVTALVLDIVRRLNEAGRSIDDPGIVLIDEVDAHLHVSWQKRIGPWLKEHFPRIQFIVSTHSPYVCQAADPGSLIRLPGPDEQEPPRVVSEELYQRVVYGSGDDAVLSDLFGLDSPYSPRAIVLREHLAELEIAVATGQADDAQVREWEDLRERLNSSLLGRVDDVRRMGSDDR